jgi:hypothetical protein
MTRRLLIIAVLLLGLVIGYLAGCRSHVQSRTVTHDPQSGQHWHERPHQPMPKHREPLHPLFAHMEDA